MKANDNWWTLQEDYQRYCTISGVTPELDVAADEHNTKCTLFMSDSLNVDWVAPDGTVVDIWCNPPLSQCKAFVLKALEQWQKYSMGILLLVPTGVISRRYFKPLWDLFKDGKINIEPLPRPKFLKQGNVTKWSARNDYILIVFPKNSRDKKLVPTWSVLMQNRCCKEK